MTTFSISLIGIGVSADAFAAALTRGVTMCRLDYRHAAIIALVFAGFQMLMPLLGWAFTARFTSLLAPVDHWIAFALLALIGSKMIWDSVSGGDDAEAAPRSIGFRRLLLLGLATSIDAAAVGASFGMLQVSILQAVLIIGLITLVLSFIAVVIGNWIGVRFRRPAELLGGLVLIGIGTKVVLDHLAFFG